MLLINIFQILEFGMQTKIKPVDNGLPDTLFVMCLHCSVLLEILDENRLPLQVNLVRIGAYMESRQPKGEHTCYLCSGLG